jgi:hypothetical protein
MDKNVLATLALDESKTLARIEPLYSSLFFHFCFSFLFKLFGVLSFSAKQKKDYKCELAVLSYKSKGFYKSNKRTYTLSRFVLKA